MFLFDRRAVRFFRKDGHSWRKKADGKTVRETHEKLKVPAFHLMCWPGAWHSCCRSSNSDMALTVPVAAAGGQRGHAELLLRAWRRV